MKQTLSLFFILFSIFFMMPREAIAAPVSLSISPPKFDLVVVPGQASTYTIRITNAQENEMSFVATTMDFAPSDKTGGLDFSHPIEGHSARDWFQINPTKFTLKPNETQPIEVTIRPPAELNPGSYFAVVMMQSQNNQTQLDNANKETVITPWIGSLFFLRYSDISSDILSNLGGNALSIKTIEYPRIHLGGALPVIVEVENHTSFHLNAKTAFRLSGIAGFGSSEQIQEELTIMPDSARLFQLILKQPPPGIQRGIVQVSSGSFSQETATKSIVTLTSNGVLLIIGVGILTDIILRYTRKTHHFVKRVYHHRKTRKLKSTKK